MEEVFKIKPLSLAQIIISIDRLTRFKPTEEKYLRVFKDVITSNLIYPKHKKNELDLMDYEALTKIVEEIFDFSLRSLNISMPWLYDINKKLLEYERNTFKLDKNIEKLVKNKIDYGAIINLLKQEKKPLPLNLQWLISLEENKNQITQREQFGLKFPVEKVVIVEGITEEILLPKFARLVGFDFDKSGIKLISAGGKNPVVKLFYQFVENLKLPIFVLLDNDANENFYEIFPKLRKNDKVHVLQSGEFEDTLPLNLIKRTLNRHFDKYFAVSLDDLRRDLPMTKILEELFKERGLEFKKSEFATLISENIESEKDVSEEIKTVVNEIKAQN